MTEFIEKFDTKNQKRHIKVKFHATVKSFKRIETFKYDGHFYRIYVNKNDSVYHLERSEVKSWKEIQKGKRVVRIPEVVENIPDLELLNKIRGNSFTAAVGKIMTFHERENF